MDRNKDPDRGPLGTGDRVATIVNILQAPNAGIVDKIVRRTLMI